VEHDFLISFLNSSIESLEKCTDHEINGIMSKDELLDRLREKKHTMERLYAVGLECNHKGTHLICTPSLQESSERDGDSSLSYSQSYSDKGSHRHSHPHPTQSQTQLHSQHRQHSPPPSGSGGGPQRLDMSKKSMSSPAVGSSCGALQNQGMIESPSMGSMQFQGSSCTIQTPQQQQPLPAPPAPAPSPSPSPAPATPTAAAPSKAAAGGDVAQDNSITSEPSETTTTTTTTSEDVVTTYKETSQMSTSQQNKPANGSTASASISASASASALRSSGGNGHGNGNGSTAALHQELQQEEADSAPDKSDDASAVPSDDGCQANGDSADNSQALDSIDSPSHRQRGLSLGRIEEGATGGGQLKVESSDVYQIVDALRRNTNLSFDLSCEALRVVLTSLEQLYNGAINPYLEAVAVHVTGKVATPKELLGITHDAKRLQYLFAQLADCKNDTEQRTWMLYEDEEDIIQFLEELVEILVRFST